MKDLGAVECLTQKTTYIGLMRVEGNRYADIITVIESARGTAAVNEVEQALDFKTAGSVMKELEANGGATALIEALENSTVGLFMAGEQR